VGRVLSLAERPHSGGVCQMHQTASGQEESIVAVIVWTFVRLPRPDNGHSLDDADGLLLAKPFANTYSYRYAWLRVHTRNLKLYRHLSSLLEVNVKLL